MNPKPALQPIPYGKQEITEADIAAVTRAMQGDLLTMGPLVEQFEKAFAAYTAAPFAVAVSNGTAALHLAAMALEVAPGNHWLTTPLTFAASGNCIRYCGGYVDFVDVDPDTLLLDLDQVEQKLKSGKYKGIVAVDYAGLPVNLEILSDIAAKYGAKIIEDAAHSPGGFFTNSKGEKNYCGDSVYADAATFSFHPVKHITTGEGGMVTMRSEAVYKKVKRYRTHGITRDAAEMAENHGGWYMEMQELGYNYRLTDILCALGISQLERADENVQKRRSIAKRYDQELANLPLKLTIPQTGIGHAYHLYVVQTEKRKALFDHLRAKNIFVQVHYIPLHTMPYYRQFGFKKGDFPVAESVYEKALSLPMYPNLAEEEQTFVIGAIREFFHQQ
jgi:UDP-4-amino-4,6-dideoxy-N-acetyl-beta-L-altrosamine transaminase